MLQARNLQKSFGDHSVVRDISFDVERGETLALLGRSGSGKTTTLKMINRLVEPDAGSIAIDGVAITDRDPIALRRGIGYVIQKSGLFPHYTVAKNIGVVPRLLEEPEADFANRLPGLLKAVGLDSQRFADKLPHELSGGEQQRVAIARALAAEPPLLLMDEPFSALDPITRREVRRHFRNLAEERGITTVIVTHDTDEALALADRICLIDDGAVVRIGTPNAFSADDPDPVVAAFFA